MQKKKKKFKNLPKLPDPFKGNVSLIDYKDVYKLKKFYIIEGNDGSIDLESQEIDRIDDDEKFNLCAELSLQYNYPSLKFKKKLFINDKIDSSLDEKFRSFVLSPIVGIKLMDILILF